MIVFDGIAASLGKQLPEGYYKVFTPVNRFGSYYAKVWEWPFWYLRFNLPRWFWRTILTLSLPIIVWHYRHGRLQNIGISTFKFKWLLGVGA